MDPRFVGRALKVGRERQGLTQEQAADIARVDERSVQRWEDGQVPQVACAVLRLFVMLCELSSSPAILSDEIGDDATEVCSVGTSRDLERFLEHIHQPHPCCICGRPL